METLENIALVALVALATFLTVCWFGGILEISGEVAGISILTTIAYVFELKSHRGGTL